MMHQTVWPYILRVVLYSAALYLIYYLFLRNRAPHRAGRIYLWLVMLLPLGLPLLHRNTTPSGMSPSLAAVTLPEVFIGGQTAGPSIPDVTESWSPLLYCGVTVFLLALLGARWLRLLAILRRGDVSVINGIRVYTNTGTGPGSIGRTVFFPDARVDALILRHELAHIRAGHRYDLLAMRLLQCFCWFNPVLWIAGSELKTVHEFEADEQASAGSPDAYARRLLDAVFGASHFTIVHSFFNPSIKRRIMMLQTNHSRKSGVLPLTAAIALTVCLSGTAIRAQQQTKSSAAGDNTAASQVSGDAGGVRDRNVMRHADDMVSFNAMHTGMVYNRVDQRPQFNGSVGAFMAKTIVYPEAARKQGKSVIRFIVNADGRVSDVELMQSSGTPVLDAEAVRAVKIMPDWKPGRRNDVPVAVYVTMPVSFESDGVHAMDGC